MFRKRLRIPAVASVIFLIAGSLLTADESKSSLETSPWKPEDVVYVETINDFSLSPDGRSVVWIRGEGDKEKDERVSNLFLTSLAEDRTVQLTREVTAFHCPNGRQTANGLLF